MRNGFLYNEVVLNLRMKKISLLFICLVIVGTSSQAQPNSVLNGNEPPSINIHRATEEITIDGVLDEMTWQTANELSNFTQYNPTDSLPAIQPTKVFVSYDENNIYLAGICYISGPNLVIPSLKRDYGFRANDNLTFIIDMFSDKTNAYAFGVNPLGVLREALIKNGGRSRGDFSFAWDNKWNCNSKIYEDKWTTEVVIPLTTLRFNDKAKTIRLNSYRGDTQANEITSWIQIPDNNILADLTFMGNLVFDEPLAKKGKNISLIPYVSGSVARDFEDENELSSNTMGNIGGDIKVGITSGLNLDLTINPDFSQVEVDRQVTNLDRFEIFFPERRQFFLENADLFGAFGNDVLNPFFSRRIGVSTDTTEDKTIQNTIYGGMRLSGKLNDGLRVGMLSMQTASQEENDLPSYNYSVLSFEQRVFDRSNIAIGFINKQAINYSSFEDTNDAFNRVGIVEYRLASSDNKWTGKFSFMKAFTVAEENMNYAQFTNLQYNTKKLNASINNYVIGEGFDAQLGFIPRRDILRSVPRISFNFYPANEKIRRTRLLLQSDFIFKLGKDDNEIVQDFEHVETNFRLSYDIDFVNSSQIDLNLNINHVTLLSDFDPTRVQDDEVFLSAGENFKNYLFQARYNTDRRKKLTISVEPIVGKFFNGFRAGARIDLGYRIQPYARLRLRSSFNRIDLGGDFNTANLWLIGPQIDLTFTKELFLTNFLQYNSQAENLNINTRLQWRFAPVSDFFLVYTDNYKSDSFDQFESRNRAIIAKFTYWLNL